MQARNFKYSQAARTILWVMLALSIPALVQAESVAPAANQVQPLLVGSAIPVVTLQSIDGEEKNLRDIVSEKPTILIFYRGGWCPYCNTHLGQLREVEDDLVGLGYQVLAVSPDSPETLSVAEATPESSYTILSDSSTAAAQGFGLVFRVDDKTLERYQQYNIDIEKASGMKHHNLPVPAAFVIGTDGIIDFAYVNPDYKVRVDPSVLLAAAKAALK